MRRSTVLALAAALVVGCSGIAIVATRALAEPPPDKPASTDPAQKPLDEATQKALQEAIAKSQAAEKKPLPVPDKLPVLKTTDLGEGLISEDLKIGDGYEVKAGGAVIAHYHGTLKADGKRFDSTYERADPAAFPLSGVIPGWQRGVPGMKVGGIRRLTIPAKLGYGEQGYGTDIPPNSDLVFIIEIVDALKIEDIKVGDGEEVGPNPVCATAYTMTDASGKEIESATRDHPFIWIPREHMGVSLALDGMKVGGKRKVFIPGPMNTGNPALSNGRKMNVPVTVELELISVRNLIPPGSGKK